MAGLTYGALKAALVAEEAARHSTEVQGAYGAAEAEGSDTDWLEVTGAMQRRVLSEVGGVPSERMAAALWVLRSAHQLWPDDAELRQLSCWVRHNRAAAGKLAPGDAAPDVPLHALDDVPLHALDGGVGAPSRAAAPVARPLSVRAACGGAPTLLVAGSFT